MQQISEIVIEEVSGEDGVKKSVTFGEVLNQITTVIFSDRDKGLKRSVADIFPDAIHLPCCFHLLQNAKKKGTVDIALFWWVQASPNVAEFELRMEKLAQKKPWECRRISVKNRRVLRLTSASGSRGANIWISHLEFV